MTWARLDDSYPHHPKMLAAGLDAFGFDVAGICYSSRFGTDGFVSDDVLAAVYPPARSPRKLAERLVSVGRWERVEGGWVIHDFLEFNPSKEEVDRRSQARAEAGRIGGIRSGESRSKPEANASPSVEANDEALTDEANEPRPVPSRPVPENARAPKRGSQAPDNILITDELKSWATSKDIWVDLGAETDKFLDYHRAKGSVFKDWTAAWRTWMRRAQEYASKAGHPTAKPSRGQLHVCAKCHQSHYNNEWPAECK